MHEIHEKGELKRFICNLREHSEVILSEAKNPPYYQAKVLSRGTLGILS